MDCFYDLSLNERQQFVYIYLKSAKKSLSHGEIAKGLGIPFNQVSPRINELRKMKLIRACKKRKCIISKKMVKTWKINTDRKRDSFDITDLL